MNIIHYEKRVKNFSTDNEIPHDNATKIISNIKLSCGHFDYMLTPCDIEVLTNLTGTLQNDYASILNSRSEVDLIHFEIRCTDLVRKILEIVNKHSRFELRLVLDDDE
jgi:hypothetical protein